jgi:probable phosphoglycerate mutase
MRTAKYLMGESPSLKAVYLIRHGATALNSQNGDGSVDRIRGWKDVPLSKNGRQEAEKLGYKLKNSGIDVIYHSPLERATDTAEEVARGTGAPLIANDKLKPWNVGELTGQESKTAHPELEKYASENPDKAVPGGESFNEFKHRTFDGLKEVLEQSGDKFPAIVTHHRVERLIKAWIKAGQKPDLSIDMKEMMKHGEGTAGHEVVHIEQDKLRPNQHLVRNLLSTAK